MQRARVGCRVGRGNSIFVVSKEQICRLCVSPYIGVSFVVYRCSLFARIVWFGWCAVLGNTTLDNNAALILACHVDSVLSFCERYISFYTLCMRLCAVFAGKIKVTEVIQDYMKGCACVLPTQKRKAVRILRVEHVLLSWDRWGQLTRFLPFF